MVAWHRLRILDTSRCIRIWGIAFHSSRSIRLRSRRVETGVICLCTARPSWSHRCSMGLRSGLHAGHSIRSTRWAWRWSVMMRARWGRALLSCMIAPAPRVRRYGKTTGVKISSLYLMAFMLPSTMMRGVFPVMEIPPQTITLPPPNGVTRSTQQSANRSPRRRHTRILASLFFRQNRDSSENITDRHRAKFHGRFCRHHRNRFVLWSTVTSGFLAALRDLSLP